MGLQPHFSGALPDWYFVLTLARDWNCPPWEIDDSDPPGIWALRQLAVNRVRGGLEQSEQEAIEV